MKTEARLKGTNGGDKTTMLDTPPPPELPIQQQPNDRVGCFVNIIWIALVIAILAKVYIIFGW